MRVSRSLEATEERTLKIASGTRVGLRSALLSAGSGWSSTANLRLTCWVFVPGHFLSRFFRLIRPLPFEVAPVLIFHCDPA